MKKLAIVWTVTLLVIVGSLTLVGLKFKADNIHIIMEDNLIKKATTYINKYPDKAPNLGESIKLTAEELISKKQDPMLEDGCAGYVIVNNTQDGFEYSSYISCLDYITKGFNNKEE